MGIFDKIKNETSKNTTRGFYFGQTEAEGENKKGIQNLDYYFEDYLNVLPQIENEKFIFIGRKGSGKSAIAKFIKDSCDKDESSFADIIKFNDVELEQVVQNVPLKDREGIELLIFEWLILVRIVKLLIENESAKYTKEYKKFKDFIQRNIGFAEIDQYHLTEVVEKQKLEISIDVLKHAFPVAIGKYFDSKRTRAPFYQFVNPLKEIIQQVLKYEVYKNNNFFILFDDLDIKFKSDNGTSKEKLLSLLRAAKNLNTSIFKNSNVKILVFLRDDIKKTLESWDSDTSKLFSSYSILLNWYDHQNFRLNENQVNLKMFANKRIAANFIANKIDFNTEDPWDSLFRDSYDQFNYKSSFKYFIDYTFYRPRDIVLFLSSIGDNDYRFPLDAKTTKMLIQKFIQQNISELKSELSIHFKEDQIKNLFIALRNLCLSGNDLKIEQVLILFNEKIKDHDSNKILEFMLNYSILILKGANERLYFNYRDNNFESIDFDSLKITVHKAIYKYFSPDYI